MTQPAPAGKKLGTAAANEKLCTTPAGGQLNSDWPQLADAIDALAVVVHGMPTTGICANKEWHIVFRCGTVVRVTDADPEFAGYAGTGYKFPDRGGDDGLASTVANVMADNTLVWDKQKAFPEPAGGAVRRAYAKLVRQGYPYPGGPESDRTPVSTGVSLSGTGTLYMVFWPNLDPIGRVYNLSFSADGLERAAIQGGTLRRYDYMFPEVAAVISPTAPGTEPMRIWSYTAAGEFALREDPPREDPPPQT